MRLFSFLLALNLVFSEAYSNHVSVPNQEIISKQFAARFWNPLPDSIVERITGNSWNTDCPIPLEDLAYIQVTHWNNEGEVCIGELIYHKNLALEIIEIFQELFEANFPINKMILIDNYRSNDELSMEDNNSSAFCSRSITGKPGVFSKHSYGGAIDINPLLNPYVKGNVILPKGSEIYLDRSLEAPGLIHEGDVCYRAFIKRGYTWGGHWISLKDYQHFEKDPLQ
ncbi:putative uncharacterized protein [Waddlia chondrophila 2032/99]|uniref:Peptidase M15C domain-containing protein n=2 Tax=Waddlia chondrophila TaxID=71667 RepID=D6YV64_WADCW|nr:M15 family metallopeptidase [Waddlia chondrophila]ADI38025.1 conserved hypothetical protein [Waddlia chondrophila WSU 86-1044]CCB91086.1 putative uncharacterized protein [Waddlia chondrophila 2032/99]